MKPNHSMDRAIRLICRLKCVRALRGHGFSASVESHSTWGSTRAARLSREGRRARLAADGPIAPVQVWHSDLCPGCSDSDGFGSSCPK
jgi:hypothetical protein